jgi:hypothetical protein
MREDLWDLVKLEADQDLRVEVVNMELDEGQLPTSVG